MPCFYALLSRVVPLVGSERWSCLDWLLQVRAWLQGSSSSRSAFLHQYSGIFATTIHRLMPLETTVARINFRSTPNVSFSGCFAARSGTAGVSRSRGLLETNVVPVSGMVDGNAVG